MLNENKIFICLTPLQMRISEQIISQYVIVNYKIICLFLIDNEKYKYYYEALKKNSSDSFVYYPKEKATGFSLLKDVYIFKKMIIKSGILNNITSVYVASIDNRYVQLIISMLKNVNVYTFDDGFANLNYNGSYYRDENLSKFRLFLWRIVGISFFAQDIRKKSEMHYTLYNGKRNITTPLNNVKLIEDIVDPRSKIQSEINIFLGQPLYEVNILVNNCFLNDTLKKLNIDLYFPHPREKYIIDSNVKVESSNLIFEDYVLDLFYKNDKAIKINIYTFFSTAVLNLDNVHFINCYVVLNEDYFGKEIYRIFNDFNVKFVFLESNL